MMDADRFLKGQTFDEFVASATKYQELWTLTARRATVPADVIETLSHLPTSVRLLTLNEDWCLDAVGVVPYVAKLAEESSHIDFRSLSRDANPELMDAHLSGGSRSIPVIIAYDANWNELGWWGSRPAELQSWVKTTGELLPKPEKYHYMRQWYARDHGATSLREIVAMISRSLGNSSAGTTGAAATAGAATAG